MDANSAAAQAAAPSALPPTAFLLDRRGQITDRVTGWDQAAITELIGRAAAITGTVLAMTASRMLYIPHPVQLLTEAQLAGRADTIFPAIVRALTSAHRNG